jgi:hypothetical protein
MTQAQTKRSTFGYVMSRPQFLLGVEDARAGRDFHKAYDSWQPEDQYPYEQGRLWAQEAPRDLPVKIRGGKVNPKAAALYKRQLLDLRDIKTGLAA